MNYKKKYSRTLNESISKRIFIGWNSISSYYPNVSIIFRSEIDDFIQRKNKCKFCSKFYEIHLQNFFSASKTGHKLPYLYNRRTRCLFFDCCYGCLCRIHTAKQHLNYTNCLFRNSIENIKDNKHYFYSYVIKLRSSETFYEFLRRGNIKLKAP